MLMCQPPVPHGQLNEEASDKVLEIEQKYSKLRRPVFEKRNKIITGIAGFWQRGGESSLIRKNNFMEVELAWLI